MSSIVKDSNRIVFKNMQQFRVGRGIRIFRCGRIHMTQQQLADKLDLELCDFDKLEQGYEPEVDRSILLSIAQLAGVCQRGTGLSDEMLLDLFLYATEDAPPEIP